MNITYFYSAAPKKVTGTHGTRFNLDNHTVLSRLDSVETFDFSDFDFYVKFAQPQSITNFFIGVHGTTTNHNYPLSKRDMTVVGEFVKFSLDFPEPVTKIVLDKPDESGSYGFHNVTFIFDIYFLAIF